MSDIYSSVCVQKFAVSIFAALFLELPEGDYSTLNTPTSEITIAGGQVTELDWRESHVVLYARASYSTHPHRHDHGT